MQPESLSVPRGAEQLSATIKLAFGHRRLYTSHAPNGEVVVVQAWLDV